MRRINKDIINIIISIIIVIIIIIMGRIKVLQLTGLQEDDDKIDIEREIRGDNLYITTADRYTTLLNDGGSYYDTRYIIDVKTKEVKKTQDHYIGFEGFEYKNKLLYSKQLTDVEYDQLSGILKKYSKEEIDENIYEYYLVQIKEYDLYIIDKEGMNKIEELLKQD